MIYFMSILFNAKPYYEGNTESDRQIDYNGTQCSKAVMAFGITELLDVIKQLNVRQLDVTNKIFRY